MPEEHETQPPIGQTVFRNGQMAWLTQQRIGDEQCVVLWEPSRERWHPGDRWSDAAG